MVVVVVEVQQTVLWNHPVLAQPLEQPEQCCLDSEAALLGLPGQRGTPGSRNGEPCRCPKSRRTPGGKESRRNQSSPTPTSGKSAGRVVSPAPPRAPPCRP